MRENVMAIAIHLSAFVQTQASKCGGVCIRVRRDDSGLQDGPSAAPVNLGGGGHPGGPRHQQR